MKFFLKLLVVFLFVGIGLVVTGIFLPEKFKSVKKMQIEASPLIVFEQVNNLKKWSDWHPWFKNDTSLQVEYLEKTEGKGAGMKINSIATGNCKVSLTHSVFPESVAIYSDYQTVSKNIILVFIEPSEEGTRINYTYNITHAELWERFFILFNKKKIDNLVTQSVIGLKAISEELKYSRIGDIQIIDSVESKPAVIKVDSVHRNKVQTQIISGFEYLNRFFERREITPLEKPFVLRYGLVNDTLEKIAVGRIVPERTWVWRTLKNYEIPEGTAVSVSYFGGRNTTKAHQAIKKYIGDNGLKMKGPPQEVALYNPETNPDSSLWETKVYYPVEKE